MLPLWPVYVVLAMEGCAALLLLVAVVLFLSGRL